ncbi:MAG: hypothetical protein Wins2KO_11950 [Winogradskyella sp.]
MLDFYLINDEQSKPNYPEQLNLEFVSGNDYEAYERLLTKGVIDQRFDFYSDFRWSSHMIKKLFNKTKEKQDSDFTILNNILRKAMDKNSGLVAYSD